jgi:diguanylate cyclase (GGDEF)-like protein
VISGLNVPAVIDRASALSDITMASLSAEAAQDSTLARLTRQLAIIEKRDWELWFIVVVTSAVVVAGLLLTLAPAAFQEGQSFHFEIFVSKDLLVGLVALVALLDVYLVTRWLELRRTRQAVISTTIQSELVRLQSFTDPLTETYNRRSLDLMATRYISHARRTHKPVTFLMADLDRLKEVNSRFGHLTGDLVISEIAGLLKQSVRGCDAVVRYGGDEFLVVLADTNGPDSAKVVERIRSYVEDWNRAGHLKDFRLTVSLGTCEWREPMILDEVLNQADHNMYAAKREVHRAD